jgi:N-acetylneuraminic acid mutarotase
VWQYTYYDSEWAVDDSGQNYIRCFPVKSEWTSENREDFEKRLGHKVHRTEFKLLVVDGGKKDFEV